MLNFKMTFYAQHCPDGSIHIQNYIIGLGGQHHVHSGKSFESWKRDSDEINWLPDGPCDCGLAVGDVREYDGKVRHNEKFE